jgi:hypothetical protein
MMMIGTKEDTLMETEAQPTTSTEKIPVIETDPVAIAISNTDAVPKASEAPKNEIAVSQSNLKAPETPAPQIRQASNVELKNGKVIYQEKKLSLDRHPVAISG